MYRGLLAEIEHTHVCMYIHVKYVKVNDAVPLNEDLTIFFALHSVAFPWLFWKRQAVKGRHTENKYIRFFNR